MNKWIFPKGVDLVGMINMDTSSLVDHLSMGAKDLMLDHLSMGAKDLMLDHLSMDAKDLMLDHLIMDAKDLMLAFLEGNLHLINKDRMVNRLQDMVSKDLMMDLLRDNHLLASMLRGATTRGKPYLLCWANLSSKINSFLQTQKNYPIPPSKNM